MKLIRTADSAFVRRAEVEPWLPGPDKGVLYGGDHAWQTAHLWDSMMEDNDSPHGPWRGPTILHHPDYQYALDNGWRPIGGPKTIDHQSRGETGSGSPYLYKISKDGVIHQAHLAVGPDEAHIADMENDVIPGPSPYGDVPDRNWRHLIMGEGNTAEGPEQHASLRDLVDDEAFRSADPSHRGYDDFKLLPIYRSEDRAANKPYDDFERKYHHTIRRAWQTGSNQPGLHWNDPIPDLYADIEKIPRAPARGREPGPRGDYDEPGIARHPRYGEVRQS